MAKIVITIEDQPDGSVRAVSEPPALGIAHRASQSGAHATSAEAYALLALRTIAEASKDEKTKKLHGPFDNFDFKRN